MRMIGNQLLDSPKFDRGVCLSSSSILSIADPRPVDRQCNLHLQTVRHVDLAGRGGSSIVLRQKMPIQNSSVLISTGRIRRSLDGTALAKDACHGTDVGFFDVGDRPGHGMYQQ